MRRVLVAFVVLLCSCSPRREAAARAVAEPAAPSTNMSISSAAFAPDGEIPAKYGCNGSNASPPLAFAGIPPVAKTLALVVEDPDAPGGLFTHWVVWNIPSSTTAVAEASAPGGIEGKSSYGKSGYGPPCPPAGEHRYVFRLFALDTTLALPPESEREQLLAAMKGHVAAEARLTGRYRK